MTIMSLPELKERKAQLTGDQRKREQLDTVKQLIAEKKKALILGVVKPDLVGVI